MESDPKSEQERLVREFSRRSLGGPGLFVPDRWYKSRDSDWEPADLAWYGNNLCVLMYMASGRKLDKALPHNFDQARGWRRQWDGGRPLNGRNKHREFGVARSDARFVVALSVVDAEGATLSLDAGAAERLGYTAYCVVPTALLRRMALWGCSAPDLAGLLQMLTTRGPLSATDADASLTDYIVKSGRAAVKQPSWDFAQAEAVPPGFLHYLQVVLSPREGSLKAAEIFSDLPLVDAVRITSAIQYWGEACRSQRTGSASITRLSHYSLFLCVGAHHAEPSYAQRAMKAWEAAVEAGDERPGPIIMYDPFQGGAALGGFPPHGPSCTEIIMRQVAIATRSDS